MGDLSAETAEHALPIAIAAMKAWEKIATETLEAFKWVTDHKDGETLRTAAARAIEERDSNRKRIERLQRDHDIWARRCQKCEALIRSLGHEVPHD